MVGVEVPWSHLKTLVAGLVAVRLSVRRADRRRDWQRALSSHEAGHVIAAWRQCRPIAMVTVKATRQADGQVEFLDGVQVAPDSPLRTDIQQARRMAAGLIVALGGWPTARVERFIIARAAAEASAELCACWPHLMQVRKALEERGSLSGGEVAEILANCSREPLSEAVRALDQLPDLSSVFHEVQRRASKPAIMASPNGL